MLQRRRFGPLLVWVCGFAALLAARDADAASIEVWPHRASAPQVLTVQPMAGSESLSFRDVKQLHFRYVALDLRGNELVVFDGSGKLQTSGAKPFWRWQLDKAVAVGKTFSPSKPLASVLMQTDDRGAVKRSQATFPAFFSGGEYDAGSLLHMFTTWMVAGLSRGFISLPNGDIEPNGAVADPNVYFEGFLTGLSSDAVITKRLPMATAIGTAKYDGNDVIVSAEQGEIVAERLVGRATLTVDGHSLLDLDTALPVYTDHKVHVRLERAEGDPLETDLVIRTYLEY
jgi:hypothetical protein